MKVKDLIKELQTCDQDSVVCVEGVAIWFVDELPGYYDGSYQEIVKGKDGPKLVIRDDGVKAVIKTLEPDWFLLDNPEAEVEIKCRPCKKEEWEKRIEEIRKENREIIESVKEKCERTFVPDSQISKTGWINKLKGIFKRNA